MKENGENTTLYSPELELIQRKGFIIQKDEISSSSALHGDSSVTTSGNTVYTEDVKDDDSCCLLQTAPNGDRHEKRGKEASDSPITAFGNGILGKCLTIFVARFSAPHEDLLKLHDVPNHLQFNRYVHAGYRDMLDFWGCIRSLFYLHNETVNIFTHVVPIIWVILYWRSMFPWEEAENNALLQTLGWCHIIASTSPWIGSVTYHLFMNHKGGASLYSLLLQIDMFGIWVTECFGALPNLTAATWCLPWQIQATILVAYAAGSAWGLRKALTAWTPLARRMCFAPVFIARILGFVLRISSYGGGNPDILLDVILQDAVSILGGMIGVIRIPEKWFPGKLDLLFNSHHIMHVLVVIAVFHMNRATNGDARWMLETQRCATWQTGSLEL